MKTIKKFCPTIFVERLTDSCNFYIKNFDAKINIDSEWYKSVLIGDFEIGFMKPHSEDQIKLDCRGLTFNFEVDDVDAEYKRLSEAELTIIHPPKTVEDYPWLGKTFAVMDINGITVFFYESKKS